MFSNQKILTLTSLFTLILFSACGLPSNQIQQTSLLQNGEDQVEGRSQLVAKWPLAQLPLDVYIDPNFAPEESEGISLMAQRWDQTVGDTGISFFRFIENRPLAHYANIGQFKDNFIGIYKMSTTFPMEYPDALGITQYFGVKHFKDTPYEYVELTHADILINFARYQFSTEAEPPEGTYDLNSVVLHEMGHFLGLQHRTDRPSIMNPQLNDGEIHDQIESEDEEEIRELYLAEEFEGKKPEDDRVEFVQGVVAFFPQEYWKFREAARSQSVRR